MSTDVTLDVPGLAGATLLAEDPVATVYRATQTAFGRPVAVKVFRDALDDDGAARFDEECRTAGALGDHPAVVTLHDAGIGDDGRPYLVMAYLPDGSLADLLARRGPVGWQEAVRIGVHVAHALAAVHRHGLVHGELHPEAVLLAPDGTPLLAEFRVTRVVGDQAGREARTPASVVWTAPEVLEGATPSVAADVYSLGALLFDLIAGAPPFSVGPDDTVDAVIGRVTSMAPAPLGPDVPTDVAATVGRALSRDPVARPVSAAALGRELHDLCRAHDLDLTDGRRWPEAELITPPRTEPEVAIVTPAAEPYRASHRVPWTGMPAWSAADPGPAPAADLDPDLDVEVLEWSGDWARVRCSNGWEAWVDGRQLVPLWP